MMPTHCGTCGKRLSGKFIMKPGARHCVNTTCPQYHVDIYPQPASPAPTRIIEGSWPEHCEQRAFVDGAKWWEFTKSGATMWSSDRNDAEVEAVRRYGPPASAPDEGLLAATGELIAATVDCHRAEIGYAMFPEHDAVLLPRQERLNRAASALRRAYDAARTPSMKASAHG